MLCFRRRRGVPGQLRRRLRRRLDGAVLAAAGGSAVQVVVPAGRKWIR